MRIRRGTPNWRRSTKIATDVIETPRGPSGNDKSCYRPTCRYKSSSKNDVTAPAASQPGLPAGEEAGRRLGEAAKSTKRESNDTETKPKFY